MKILQLSVGIFFTFIFLIILPSNVHASDIRVTGFTYPRNEYYLLDETGGPIDDFVIGTTNLIGEFGNPGNFGMEGTVPCPVSYTPFVTSIEAGSLVDGLGNRLVDMFFASDTNDPLTTDEAQELKKFIEAGGVVYISGAFDVFNGTRYDNLFIALGIGDRYKNEVDFSTFEGESSDPIGTVVTNGPFGFVGPLTHAPFNPIDTVSLLALADGFETSAPIGTFAVTLGSGLSDEVVLAEGQFGDGYLSVVGTPLHWNSYTGADPDNVKYFLNLFARACGESGGSSVPAPFLRLPWDYEGQGKTFGKAALQINSYFDHEYPLLSVSSLSEPDGTKNSVVIFSSSNRNFNEDYSRHDGYDWGRSAGAKYKEPVLAAAAGVVTYSNSCSACGNAILVDHGNGYQTRYYHLSGEGLVVDEAGESKNVSQGEQIGKVGFTGKVSPSGEKGAHLHFMVVKDTDEDGQFSDNIPEGIVDPFGWQSTEPDPWPDYTFMYGGSERTGSTSYYLWQEAIPNLSEELPANGGFYRVDSFELSFPGGLVDDSATLNMELSPSVSLSESFQSIGPGLNVNVIDASGNFVTDFNATFTITIDFDLLAYDADTLTIFSSQDGENWTAEGTTVDMGNKLASAEINHLSQFALFADLADADPPTTTAIMSGEAGEAGWYRSDVEVNLMAEDGDGLGVDYTVYALGMGEWMEYTAPLVFADEGDYKVTFYSVDTAENIEEDKEVEFHIDKKLPEALIGFDTETRRIEVRPMNLDDNISEANTHGKTKYILSDQAQNTLELETRRLDFGKTSTLSILSFKYSDGKESDLFPGSFHARYTLKKGDLNNVFQSWIARGKAAWISYTGNQNLSRITILDNGVRIREKEDGLKLLYLVTEDGNLELAY